VNPNRHLRKLLLALDGVSVIVSMLVAAGLHARLRAWVPALREPPRFDEYAILIYLALPIFLGLIVVLGLHRFLERLTTWPQFLWDLVKLHAGALVSLSVLLFFTQAVLNRSIVVLFFASTFALLALERAILGGWLRFQHVSGQGRQRLLLVGAPGPAIASFVRTSASEPLPPAFVGYLGPGGAGSGLERLGDIEDLDQVLVDQAVDGVLFFPPFEHPARAGDALQCCDAVGVPASFLVDVEDSALHASVVAMAGRPFVRFEGRVRPPEALAIKHAFDFVSATLGLLVLSPLLAALSVAILLTMGRPVFFGQERAGLYGRRFRMWKFRTMVRDAERRRAELEARNEMSGPVFKVTGDPRVTPLGGFLRKTSLDELPQLFNVLLGQMSLVGPRPLPVGEQQQIRGWHRRRLSMKPGITGLWQVSGRNEIDFEEWMRLDLAYVDRWSPRTDAQILARTVPAVLAGRGAK
jgi:exopolysaccharide biosynthesis polyprenyl glycosylphosphotransferase